MPLYLTRHASAGKRGTFTGHDLERPLDSVGRDQAREIASRLVDRGIDAIYSSPAARCVDTIEPLAEKLGLVVQVDSALAEGQSARMAVHLLRRLARNSITGVLCSHGDIIPDAIEWLERDGMQIQGERRWPKGSTWKLDTIDARIVSAVFLGP